MVLRQVRADAPEAMQAAAIAPRPRLDAGHAEPRRRLGQLRSRQRQGLADPGAVRRSQRDDRSQHRRHHRPRARVPRLLPGIRRAPSGRSRARCGFCGAIRPRDGAWYGRWGVNYIYGTWQVLRGLALHRRGPDRAVRAPRACAGCSPTRTATAAGARASRATTTRARRGVGPSTPSQTAWAVMGLVAGAARSAAPPSAAASATCWTARTPTGPGSKTPWTGTGFPEGLLSRTTSSTGTLPADGARAVPARHRDVRAGATISQLRRTSLVARRAERLPPLPSITVSWRGAPRSYVTRDESSGI